MAITGSLTASNIAGISSTNLLDKAAVDSILAAWTFLDDLTMSGGNIVMAGAETVDGVDVSAHAANTDAHHAEAHTPESHTGTDITAAELETLSDASDADALHNHPSDMTPAEHTAVGDGAPHHAKYTDAEAVTAVATADPYLKNDGDIGTGVYDFGGATSLEVPSQRRGPYGER
jgi:hypothetical protein